MTTLQTTLSLESTTPEPDASTSPAFLTPLSSGTSSPEENPIPFGSSILKPSFRGFTPIMETVTFDPDGDLFLILQRHPSKTPEPLVFGTSSPLISRLPNLKVRFRVSSKHMTLASPVFKAMLRRDAFKEGQELHTHGQTEVALPDDDISAFTVLLNLVHGQTSKVPREIETDLLVKIAILVDKYQMHEVVGIASESWMNAWKQKRAPKPSDIRVTLSWITLYWIFGGAADFKEITEFVICRCDHTYGRLPDDDRFPIPDYVIDAIHNSREKLIQESLHLLDNLIRDYQSADPANCNYCYEMGDYGNSLDRSVSCDLMVLGSLLKGAMSKNTALWPPPLAPYTNMTWFKVNEQISGIEIRTLCRYAKSSPRCAVEDIKSRLEVDFSRVGLSLGKLKSSSYKS